MNINLYDLKKKYESKLSQINKLRGELKNINNILIDLKFLKDHAGEMIFTGRSGKIGEHNLLKEVKINDISGCVEVPSLLVTLAWCKKTEILQKIENLIDEEGVNNEFS